MCHECFHSFRSIRRCIGLSYFSSIFRPPRILLRCPTTPCSPTRAKAREADGWGSAHAKCASAITMSTPTTHPKIIPPSNPLPGCQNIHTGLYRLIMSSFPCPARQSRTRHWTLSAFRRSVSLSVVAITRSAGLALPRGLRLCLHLGAGKSLCNAGRAAHAPGAGGAHQRLAAFRTAHQRLSARATMTASGPLLPHWLPS